MVALFNEPDTRLPLHFRSNLCHIISTFKPNFQIYLTDSSDNILDKYTQRVGFRTITWDSNTLYINQKPIYLRGFAHHADAEFHGRAYDSSFAVRDYNLFEWFGANSIITSYPPAEESLDLADERGIIIIEQVPASNLK